MKPSSAPSFILSLILFFTLAQGMKAQALSDKNRFSLSGSYLFYGSDNSILFPSAIKSGRTGLRADCLQQLLPFLKVGIEGSWVSLNISKSQDKCFIVLSSSREQLITAGLNVTLCIPPEPSGKSFLSHFQLGVAPVAVFHTGTRQAIIDNTFYESGNPVPLAAVMTITNSTRPGLSITPAFEYPLFKYAGLRLSANSLFTTLKSSQTTEKMAIHSVNLGVVVPL